MFNLAACIIGLTGFFLTAGTAVSAPVAYAVAVKTTPQIGYLDLQFLPGPGAAFATATISDFALVGGGQLLSPVDTVFPLPFNTPTATGSLATQVTIVNSNAFNAWLQRIQFGTALRFLLTLNGPALEPGMSMGGTDFSLSLYGADGFDLTGSPAVVVAIGSEGGVTTTAASGASINISTIPEPASLLLGTSTMVALLVLILPRNLRRRETATRHRCRLTQLKTCSIPHVAEH